VRRRSLAAALALLVIGVEGAFYHPGQWNQNARLAATVAFVEPGTPYTGTFRIDGLKDGTRLFTGDWARSQGAFYSNKAPGVSLLGVPPYFLLYYVERLAGIDPTTVSVTQTNAYLLNLGLSVFWNVVAAMALLRRLPRLGLHSERGAAVAAIVYSFATLVLPFGCSTWGHTTAAAFILLGTLDAADSSRDRSVVAGVWFGLAALTEYLAALSLVAGAIFLLAGSRRFQRLLKFSLGAAPPVAALLVFQRLAFGSYFTTATSLSNPVFLQPGKAVGLFGVAHPENLVRMLLAPGRGLFWQAPVLLFAAFGVVTWYRSGRRAVLALAVGNITAYALSLSAVDAYEGGLTTSMRYMIVTLPFFCILLPNLESFVFPKIFVLVLAVSAANMFVLAATSTMYASFYPLSQFAYPDFLRGRVAFSPPLAGIGVHGPAAGFVAAAVFAILLGWLLRKPLARESYERV